MAGFDHVHKPIETRAVIERTLNPMTLLGRQADLERRYGRKARGSRGPGSDLSIWRGHRPQTWRPSGPDAICHRHRYNHFHSQVLLHVYVDLMDTGWALAELQQFVEMTDLVQPPATPGVVSFGDDRYPRGRDTIPAHVQDGSLTAAVTVLAGFA